MNIEHRNGHVMAGKRIDFYVMVGDELENLTNEQVREKFISRIDTDGRRFYCSRFGKSQYRITLMDR